MLITLKLLGKITWPWVWVLAPAWMSFALVLAILAFGLLVAFTKE